MTYSDRFYSYQTKARGLLDPKSLEALFDKLNSYYWARFGRYLPRNKRIKCLDVASGYGNFVYFLRARGYVNVQGYDLDENQVALARSLNLPVEVGNVFDVMARGHRYELISAFDFIEHLSKDKALNFLDGCFESLEIGGALIIRTPSADGPFGSHDSFNDITHEWAMSSTLLIDILKMVGFSKVTLLDERPQPTSVINFLRWLVHFPVRMLANLICVGIGMRPPRVWTRSMIAIAYKY